MRKTNQILFLSQMFKIILININKIIIIMVKKETLKQKLLNKKELKLQIFCIKKELYFLNKNFKNKKIKLCPNIMKIKNNKNSNIKNNKKI